MKRKVTEDQEKQIRRLYFKEGLKGPELSQRFGVSNTTLARILGESPSGKGFKPESIYS